MFFEPQSSYDLLTYLEPQAILVFFCTRLFISQASDTGQECLDTPAPEKNVAKQACEHANSPAGLQGYRSLRASMKAEVLQKTKGTMKYYLRHKTCGSERAIDTPFVL